MSDFKTHDHDSILITYDIGAPQHTSSPLPKRRGVPSLTLPVADTHHHVPTLSSLHPMSSPTYLQATSFSSPYSFFPPCSTKYYTPNFRPGSYMASSCTLPPSSPFLPLSPPFLPPNIFSPTFPPTQSLEFSSVPLSPCFLPSTQTRAFSSRSSSILSIQKVSDPSHPVVSTPTEAPVTPPCHLFKSLDASPVMETRPFDFQTPPCRRPNIGKAVDDIISKTLGKDPATTTTDSISDFKLPSSSRPDIGKTVDDIISKTLETVPTTKTINCLSSDRQSVLENRLQSLQSRFPAEIKELSSFLAFHSSSIQKEHEQCLQDGFFPTDYHNWLTNRYTDQLHLVFTSIERSLNNLENQDKKLSRPASRNLNPESIILMETWYHEHLNNPYPTHTEAEDMANKGGITLSQLRKWFANKRHRTRRPRSVKARAASKHCEEFLSGIFQL